MPSAKVNDPNPISKGSGNAKSGSKGSVASQAEAQDHGQEEVVEVAARRKIEFDMNGQAAIHRHCISGDEDALLAELELFPTDVDLPNQFGDTPLHLAISTDEPSICEILISHNADPTALNVYTYMVIPS